MVGAYMTDNLLLHLLGQICELETRRARNSLGGNVRRHRVKLAGAAQKSAAKSAGVGKEGLILRRDNDSVVGCWSGLAAWQGEKCGLRRPLRQKQRVAADDAIALKRTQNSQW